MGLQCFYAISDQNSLFIFSAKSWKNPFFFFLKFGGRFFYVFLFSPKAPHNVNYVTWNSRTNLSKRFGVTQKPPNNLQVVTTFITSLFFFPAGSGNIAAHWIFLFFIFLLLFPGEDPGLDLEMVWLHLSWCWTWIILSRWAVPLLSRKFSCWRNRVWEF